MEIPGELPNPVSIIVCTVDRLTDLEECLKSLRPFRTAVVEIIVVNNGPHLAAVEEVAKRHSATVVTEPQLGVSRARNTGIRAATGRILAFLDDDSVADPNWLPLLLTPLRDPQVLAVVGSVFAQTLRDPVSQAFDYLHRDQFPDSQLILDGNAQKNSFPMRSALVGNANMAIRREVVERFGYFDTRLGRGTRIGSGEEPDLLLRVLLGHARIVVEPAARILHRHSTEWVCGPAVGFPFGLRTYRHPHEILPSRIVSAGPDPSLCRFAPGAADRAGGIGRSEIQSPKDSAIPR